MSDALEIDIGHPELQEPLQRLLARLHKAGFTEPGRHHVTIQHAAFVQLPLLRQLEQVRLPIPTGDLRALQILKIHKVVEANPVRQSIEIETIVRLVGVPIPDGPVLSLSNSYLMRHVPEDVQRTLVTLLREGLGEGGKPFRTDALQTIGLTRSDVVALTRTILPPIYGQPSTRAFAGSFNDRRGDGGDGIILNITLVR